MKIYIKVPVGMLAWAILFIWMIDITACCLITVPVETSIKATGTLVDTGVKAVTAPVRWISRKIANGFKDSKK